MSEKTYIALAGNPNCGKTTLFNELTGSNGYVGNWPGVTVEKKQAAWTKDKSCVFVDLPGIYSLSPYSPEEVVSRDYLINEAPSAIINLLDATNLERSLYLTTQLLESGCPVVVGLNMADLLKERGDVVDTAKLSEFLGVEVTQVSALKGTNIQELVQSSLKATHAHAPQQGLSCFSPQVEQALEEISKLITDKCDLAHLRWYAIKVFERDSQSIASLQLTQAELDTLESIIVAVEEAREDDAESIITSDRYDWIGEVVSACMEKAPAKLTISQAIDRVVTNRFLGLPIFALVMFLVYYLSISTIGKGATDWVNDNLFGDGFFISQTGEEAYTAVKDDFDDNHYQDQIDGYLAAAKDEGMDTEEAESALKTLKDDPDDEDAASTLDDFVSEAEEAGVVAHDVALHNEDGNFIDTEDEAVTSHDAGGEPVLEDGQELKVIDEVDAAAFKHAATAL